MATTFAGDDISDSADAAAKGVYHFLDVGGVKYGECTLVEFGDLRVLIDGSHVQDFRGQTGYKSIPDQLAAIFKSPPPHDVALVVVTHCHADHVGCLPELIANDIVRPRFALLTDPQLGFGRLNNTGVPPTDAAHPDALLAALLREEDATDLNDAELAEFIDAVASVESRYAKFVQDLKDRGVDVTFHRGRPLKPELATLLKPTNITLLGPSTDQLLRCAEQIATTNKEAEDAIRALPLSDTSDIATLYRSIIADSSSGDVQNPRGNGMNCQSITFAFGPPGARALLAGDMQFAEPGVKQMDGEIAKLRRAAIANGPYTLFKTTHHTSHNGQDDAFLNDIGSPPLIVHSGGIRDTSHPYPSVLQMLKARSGIFFARTDHNGAITVRPDLAPAAAISTSKGQLNDFLPNKTRDEAPSQIAKSPQFFEPSGPSTVPASSVAGPQIIIVNLPPGPIDLTVGGVDIQVRGSVTESAQQVNQTNSRISPSVGWEPDGGALGIAPGRSISKLLFVTDPERLVANIGRAEAKAALDGVLARGGRLETGPGDQLLDKVRRNLSDSKDVEGLVLLGGYDVVPPARRDVLGAELRDKLGTLVAKDADQFWIWSDSSYADLDGDAIAEIPVSRVPDALNATLFANALSAAPLKLGERFGVHNIARPFARDVWRDVSGTRNIEVCEFFGPEDVVAANMGASSHYYMLHGSEDDGSRFVGENERGGQYPTAVTSAEIPSKFDGLVFSGCCWGALIVKGKAVDHPSGVPLPRLAGESIALSYLKAGALAFIGCTGSHYSGPSTDPDENYASRLHTSFWMNLPTSLGSPSRALFKAKREYAASIVSHGVGLNPVETARRLKNLAQFTCLGLGW